MVLPRYYRCFCSPQNFAPVPYPKNDYGKFYSGDSYIVLETKQARDKLSWDIFFWLGKDTSQVRSAQREASSLFS